MCHPEFTIRRGDVADASILADIHRSARRDAMPDLPELHSEAETRDWMQHDVLARCDVMVAERGLRVLGFIAVSAGWIEQLHIATDAQAGGIGTALVVWAKQHAVKTLRLWTFQANKKARAFYEARGFHSELFTDGRANEERTPDVLYRWYQLGPS